MCLLKNVGCYIRQARPAWAKLIWILIYSSISHSHALIVFTRVISLLWLIRECICSTYKADCLVGSASWNTVHVFTYADGTRQKHVRPVHVQLISVVLRHSVIRSAAGSGRTVRDRGHDADPGSVSCLLRRRRRRLGGYRPSPTRLPRLWLSPTRRLRLPTAVLSTA